MKRKRLRFLGIAATLVVQCGWALPSSALDKDKFRVELLPDQVERWYHVETHESRSRFFKRLEETFDVVLPDKFNPPFRRSVAVLVGVSEYQALSQLSSVTNDLTKMRLLLLEKGGFDEVYVIQNRAATKDNVELYVKDVALKSAGGNGRILFYYSGHGAALKTSGYLQFSGALPDRFVGQQILSMKALREWSSELDVKHFMVVLDCCAAGMILTQRSTPDERQALMRTLSGNGSRTFLTAGTAEERTFSEQAREKVGAGVFTDAFVNAFRIPDQESGFLTIGQIFNRMRISIARFSIENSVTIHPQIEVLQSSECNGTFIFLNPDVVRTLSFEEASSLGLRIRSRTGEVSPEEALGIIKVTSTVSGQLFVDQVDMGWISAGQTAMLEAQRVGEHRVEIRGLNNMIYNIPVKSGNIALVSFTSEAQQILTAPTSAGPTSSTGSLMFKSAFDGDLFIDAAHVGKYNRKTHLKVPNLRVGPHVCTLRAAHLWIEEAFFIEKQKTTFLGSVDPPMNLRILN